MYRIVHRVGLGLAGIRGPNEQLATRIFVGIAALQFVVTGPEARDDELPATSHPSGSDGFRLNTRRREIGGIGDLTEGVARRRVVPCPPTQGIDQREMTWTPDVEEAAPDRLRAGMGRVIAPTRAVLWRGAPGCPRVPLRIRQALFLRNDSAATV
jgi:hypothetical protein